MAHKVLINGQWRDADASGTFQAANPATGQSIPEDYPVSNWSDINEALDAAVAAADALQAAGPAKIADFLDAYADGIDAAKESLVAMANQETALPASPRLGDVELPRTSNQLRQAAQAARDGSWALPTIDTATGIRSVYGAIGPVCVFGPNNFPFAFGSVSGGDFAAAVAAGNPVIGKANSSHPGTTRIFAELAQTAIEQTGLHPATVQLIYRTSHADGERMVADSRVGATGYTGSRGAGLKLKAAADAAGKPIYLELSSVNPVVILPGALRERGEDIVNDFTTSCLMGTGQFCTNPGLVVLQSDEASDQFVSSIQQKFANANVGILLSSSVQRSLKEALTQLVAAGAEVLVGNEDAPGDGFNFANTLLKISGRQFIEQPEMMQTEAFGNASLLVVAENIDEICQVLENLEGNLTGCFYTSTAGDDDAGYDKAAPKMRAKVGRLLNDKMPTGVAVSSAMNHGGPYPATGHPGFTAVGVPGSLIRFAMLQCYDNVRAARLPAILSDDNPSNAWRNIDGEWRQGSLA